MDSGKPLGVLNTRRIFSNTVTNYREGKKSLCVPYAVHACYKLA